MSVLVIDVGTSSIRAVVADDEGRILVDARRPSLPSTPFPGLVEFDAAEMARTSIDLAREVLDRHEGAVDAVGITNQRASTIVWDPATGEPVAPGIGWQDLRTVGECLALQADGFRLAPNHSATKCAALLDAADPDRTILSRPPKFDAEAFDAEAPRQPPPAGTSPQPAPPPTSNFFARHWRGEYSIGRSLFVNILAIDVVLVFLLANVTSFFTADTSPAIRGTIVVSEIVFMLAVLVWQTVGYVRSVWGAKARGVGRVVRWSAWIAVPILVIAAILLAVSLAATVSNVRRAASPTAPDGSPLYRLTLRDETLVFEGQVVWPIVADFRSMLASGRPIRNVLLRSPGGDVVAARRVFDMLQPRGLTTAVTQFCHSACTIMFAAGQRRAVSRTAQLGFHATSVILMDEMMSRIMNALTLRNDRLNASYYLRAGFDPAFVERAVTTPSTELFIPPVADLQRAGVVTIVLQQ